MLKYKARSKDGTEMTVISETTEKNTLIVQIGCGCCGKNSRQESIIRFLQNGSRTGMQDVKPFLELQPNNLAELKELIDAFRIAINMIDKLVERNEVVANLNAPDASATDAMQYRFFDDFLKNQGYYNNDGIFVMNVTTDW